MQRISPALIATNSITASGRFLRPALFCCVALVTLFQIAAQDYAFRIEQIQEIVVVSQLTRLPQVATYVEGVSNLRGTIITGSAVDTR